MFSFSRRRVTPHGISLRIGLQFACLVRYPESNLGERDEIMGSLDSVCAEDTPAQCNSSQSSVWQPRPRGAPFPSTTLALSSEATTSSEDSSFFIPETPSPLLKKSKRRLCDSDSNSPKRHRWSGTTDAEEEVDSSLPSPPLTPPPGVAQPSDLDLSETSSLTENMNSLLRQDSGSSSSHGLGATSASTEDEEDETATPLRVSRRSFGRAIILSSDDSDLDLVLSSPSGGGRSNGSGTTTSVRRPITTRRSQTGGRDRTGGATFSAASSSSGERGGGTVFHARRCRRRMFSGKKLLRGREGSVSPCGCRGSNETESPAPPLQQDMSSPHTPRRSRIFSSRRYHHVSPRARLEERTANQGPGAMFSGSPTFRRDDPGRRPLTRSSHSSQGRRATQPSTGSPPNRENFCSNIQTLADVFDADSDESTEFFTASSAPSESEERRRRLSGGTSPRRRNGSDSGGMRGDNRMRRRRTRFATADHIQVGTENSDDDVRVVFPANYSPTTFHPSSGRRQRRGTRSRRRHISSEREISSPDPVQQVAQVEEDERMARMLQAQFDAELHVVAPPAALESEDDMNIHVVVDQESSEGSTVSSESSTFSSESSASSSRQDETMAQIYGRRPNRNPSGNWRRRGANQRNWQIPRIVRRTPRTNPLINILAFSVSQSGSDEYDYEALWDLVQVVGDVVPRGLVPQQLNRLPTRLYGEDEVKSKECQVCLSEFEKQDLLRILPCFHEFHAACIDKWLPTNRTCPVCRAEVEVD